MQSYRDQSIQAWTCYQAVVLERYLHQLNKKFNEKRASMCQNFVYERGEKSGRLLLLVGQRMESLVQKLTKEYQAEKHKLEMIFRNNIKKLRKGVNITNLPLIDEDVSINNVESFIQGVFNSGASHPKSEFPTKKVQSSRVAQKVKSASSDSNWRRQGSAESVRPEAEESRDDEVSMTGKGLSESTKATCTIQRVDTTQSDNSLQTSKPSTKSKSTISNNDSYQPKSKARADVVRHTEADKLPREHIFLGSSNSAVATAKTYPTLKQEKSVIDSLDMHGTEGLSNASSTSPFGELEHFINIGRHGHQSSVSPTGSEESEQSSLPDKESLNETVKQLFSDHANHGSRPKEHLQIQPTKSSKCHQTPDSLQFHQTTDISLPYRSEGCSKPQPRVRTLSSAEAEIFGASALPPATEKLDSPPGNEGVFSASLKQRWNSPNWPLTNGEGTNSTLIPSLYPNIMPPQPQNMLGFNQFYNTWNYPSTDSFTQQQGAGGNMHYISPIVNLPTPQQQFDESSNHTRLQPQPLRQTSFTHGFPNNLPQPHADAMEHGFGRGPQVNGFRPNPSFDRHNLDLDVGQESNANGRERSPGDMTTAPKLTARNKLIVGQSDSRNQAVGGNRGSRSAKSKSWAQLVTAKPEEPDIPHPQHKSRGRMVTLKKSVPKTQLDVEVMVPPPPLPKISEKPKKAKRRADRNIVSPDSDGKVECSICWDDLTGSLLSAPYKLKCGHDSFHHVCLVKWLHTAPTCPICRTPVNETI